MEGRLIFLLEEPSMKALLDGLLPRLFPDWEPETHFKCIPHQGKSDLDVSWYVGDLVAFAAAFEDPKLNSPALRKRFNEPDTWEKPSVELKRLIPSFQKVGAARSMSSALQPGQNRSKSFQVFV